jgi:hypothetical protein
VPRQGAECGYIEVVAEQAELVRQIFRWVADEGLALRVNLWAHEWD